MGPLSMAKRLPSLPIVLYCITYIVLYCIIREYGSTLYVGMVRVVTFSLYIGIGAKIQNRLKIAKKKAMYS